MTTEQAAQFENECRALFDRHQAVGFFSYMTEDGKVYGQVRAHATDRMGILIGAQELGATLMGRFRRATARASA